MKKFKKLLLPLSLGMVLLASTSVFANEYQNKIKKETNHIEEKTGTHHLSNENVKGVGYENVPAVIECPNEKEIHNMAKVHYYNRTSEPVTVQFNNKSITVEPWSGNSFEVSVYHDLFYITVRGLNDNSNQVLNGELSVKSWAE